MRIMTFDGAEKIGSPPDWDDSLDGTCLALPAAVVPDLQSGLNQAYSLWVPDADEVAMLAAGGAIRLGVLGVGLRGGGHPVVNMAVMKPEVVREVNAVALDWPGDSHTAD